MTRQSFESKIPASGRDDYTIPFQVEQLDVRGRTVRLGPLLDAILGRHDYPEPVSRLLAEVITITVLLGASLKFQGKFILQTRTDGPVDMLVADISTPGSVRAYAHFDGEKVDQAIASGQDSPSALLGEGVLAMTIDQGPNTNRYQGIVSLDGSDLEEIARQYFRQSEQLPSEIKLAVAKLITNTETGGSHESWRAGGLFAQFLPDAPERMRLPDLPSGNDDADELQHDPTDDAWVELTALVSTIGADELLDPAISNEKLLYRLFHEHGVRVFDGIDLRDDCSCSRDKIEAVLDAFSEEQLEESTEDGVIVVKCEFCSKTYRFDPDKIRSE